MPIEAAERADVRVSEEASRDKRRANIRAEALIARHGEDAWSIVYGICRDPDRDAEDRRFYYLVRDIIERRLGIPPRVDTATRYLEAE